jgi:uncharacterized membrane protein
MHVRFVQGSIGRYCTGRTIAMIAVHIAFFVLAPALARLLAARWRPAGVLGPVVLCYVLGISWGNQPWLPVPHARAEQVAGAGVVLAIALMLLALDVRAWRHLARGTALAALLAFASSMIASGVGAWLFRDSVAESWSVAGMLAGVYIGGTVNMAAIATALEVPHERFLALSAADVTLGGAYYFLLLIAGARLFGWVLRPPGAAHVHGGSATAATVHGDAAHAHGAAVTASVAAPGAAPEAPGPRVHDVVAALAAGVAVVGAALAASQLAPAGARDAVLVCLVSTLAIVLSLHPRIRSMPATYATGEYMLLVFCVAVGSLARPHALADADPALLAYMAVVMFGAIAMHTAACRLLGIDRDTCIITSTAAIYGPPFVPAIAIRLENRALIISGVTTGVAGIALGNYLGLAVAACMRWLGA